MSRCSAIHLVMVMMVVVAVEVALLKMGLELGWCIHVRPSVCMVEAVNNEHIPCVIVNNGNHFVAIKTYTRLLDIYVYVYCRMAGVECCIV